MTDGARLLPSASPPELEGVVDAVFECHRQLPGTSEPLEMVRAAVDDSGSRAETRGRVDDSPRLNRRSR